MAKIIEVCGRRVRVQAYVENGDVYIEVARIWGPAYEKPVVLVTSKSRLREAVESLISEIAFLLRELVEKVAESEVQ